MENFPLISVIVPIYNVEKYLIACLESLAKQTYPDFEIIMVDDGSTDQCPSICDKFAKKYNNFKVIHQKNMGLVKLRLNSVQYANGNLITFVDGDDWVEPEYLSYLYSLRKKYNADISVCAPYNMGSLYMFLKKAFVTDNINAMRIIFSDKFYAGYIWNKLYPKELWHNLKLPPQTMFDDLFLNSQILTRINKVVFSSKRLYHYRIITGSISHNGFQANRLLFYNITDDIKKWALSVHSNALFVWITNVQFISYIRNNIHLWRNKQNEPELWAKLNSFAPSFKWYLSFKNGFFLKYFSLFWLLIDNIISDFYSVFFTKKELK